MFMIYVAFSILFVMAFEIKDDKYTPETRSAC
jgi:hypothetical protein